MESRGEKIIEEVFWTLVSCLFMESISLELLHTVQLDMLFKFDNICTEHNLTYFLDSGTALGAVRHHGFIPWDDDVDVAMPRDDYNRLLKIGVNGLSDNLFIQTYETDPAYMMPFAKLRLGDSFFPEKERGLDKLKYRGIYIDIFPYDKVPKDEADAKKRIRRSRFWYYISVFSRRNYPGKKPVIKFFTSFLHKLSDKTVYKFHKFYDEFCMKHNEIDSDVFTCFCWRMSQKSTYLFKQSELFPTQRIDFEGLQLSIVKEPDIYLTKMFGDYHILPPESDRKSHLAGPFIIKDTL